MRIAVRNKADGPWRLVASAEYGNEAERGPIYVAKTKAGPWGEGAVHVREVQ